MRTPPTRVARKSPATWKRFARVVEAEKSVEDYKVANGRAGASAIQQQLKDLNDQIVAARQRMSDAHARSDQIEVARRKGGDVGSDAAQLDLTSLGPLRAQQAEAHKKFVEAAELRSRHPQVIDAQARLRAADAAVVAEFARLAQIQRTDYAGAKALEASLTRQVDDLERQTNANDPSMIGLRDLERKASAARDVYELFVNRSRDTGETKQIEPTGAKIISTAAPPSTRTFPPNSYLLAELGFLLGLGLGYLSALRRGGRGPAPDAPPIGADDDRSPVERAQPPRARPEPARRGAAVRRGGRSVRGDSRAAADGGRVHAVAHSHAPAIARPSRPDRSGISRLARQRRRH